jgi:hypothetical protein
MGETSIVDLVLGVEPSSLCDKGLSGVLDTYRIWSLNILESMYLIYVDTLNTLASHDAEYNIQICMYQVHV